MWIAATAVVSSACTYCLTGNLSRPARAAVAELAPLAPANAKLSIDEHDMRWNYMNAYRVHTTAEEVILDFGFNMLDPNNKPGGEQAMIFRVPERNIMTYATAKRLRDSLDRLVQKFEKTYGPINTPTEVGK